MPHMTVVRNEAYQVSGFAVRYRHNERENKEYFNGDIEPERANLNIHFRQNFKTDGSSETYGETFDRLLAERKIVKHGTKAAAKLFCEMVFDVNTAYFAEKGGYEYAKKYFEEVYRLAVKEIGSEDYIISAVMHADERNKALSEQLGHDAYHYHLHVVYVPVVEKKLYFKKNNKNPELAGKLKEIIPQISHANKWPRRVQVERNGKMITLNSYSLLQDRYYEHMKAAGFDGFERGEFGSTAEHLDVLDFKIKQDIARADAVAAVVERKQETATALDIEIKDKQKISTNLDMQANKRQKQLEKLDKQITVKEKAKATIEDIDKTGRPTVFVGGFNVTADELEKLKTLAKKSVYADDKVKEANRKRKVAEGERDAAKAELTEEKKKRPSLNEHLTWFNKFFAALKRAPKRLMAVIEDIMRQPPEQPEPEHQRIQSKTSVR